MPQDNSLLLHICCAPCAVACVDALKAEGFALHGYFNNFNIHPLKEYRARKTTLEAYARSIHLKLTVVNDYGLRQFINAAYPNFDPRARCEVCYRTRLEQSAVFAKENGFPFFTTTLLISPYQQHNLIHELGKKIGEAHGVEFLYRDFRPLFREGQERAREKELYMQKYCGCVFSEEERYRK